MPRPCWLQARLGCRWPQIGRRARSGVRVSCRLLRAGFQLGRFDSRLLRGIGYCSRDRIVRLLGGNGPRSLGPPRRVGRRRDLCLRQWIRLTGVRRYRCRLHHRHHFRQDRLCVVKGIRLVLGQRQRGLRVSAAWAPRRRRLRDLEVLAVSDSRALGSEAASASWPDCLRRRRPLERRSSMRRQPAERTRSDRHPPGCRWQGPSNLGSESRCRCRDRGLRLALRHRHCLADSSTRIASISARSASSLFVKPSKFDSDGTSANAPCATLLICATLRTNCRTLILYLTRVTRRLIAVPITLCLRIGLATIARRAMQHGLACR